MENDQDNVEDCAEQIASGICPEGSSNEYFLWRSFGVPNCGCVQAGFVDSCPVGEDGWDGEVALRRRPILVKWMIPVESQTLKVGVGATIAFSWSGNHDVHEFTKRAAFDQCDFNQAVLLSDSSSMFEMTLNKNLSVTRYFGCSRSRHCDHGQKLELIIEDQTTTTPIIVASEKTSVATSKSTTSGPITDTGFELKTTSKNSNNLVLEHSGAASFQPICISFIAFLLSVLNL